MIFNNFRCLAIFCVLFWNSFVYAQNYQKLTLNQAIDIGLKNNKTLKIQSLKTKINEISEKDLKNEKLPEINFHSGFHVLSNIRQYENGFTNPSTTYVTPRIKYDFTLSTEIPVYLGGKLKIEEQKAAVATEINQLKTQKDERELRMQIITAYLQVLHLQEQQTLLQSKMKEDEAVINQTEKLQKNGVVTYNEVLRTKLQWSNHEMSFSELSKEIEILEHEIKTLLSLPEEQVMHIDTQNLFTHAEQLGAIDELMNLALEKNESIKINQKDIEEKELDKKLIKTNVLPKITAGGEYGYNYPNMLFFPPVEHLYRFGAVGFNLILPLDNFYKNKFKMQMANENIAVAKLELETNQEKIKHEVFAAQKNLEEASHKITIAEKAIEQAQENYRIVKVKYANQLSLITELIDADNVYLEAQSHLISLQINKQLKYYQLQYVIGNL